MTVFLSVSLYSDGRVERRERELDWNGLFPLSTELSIKYNTREHNHRVSYTLQVVPKPRKWDV